MDNDNFGVQVEDGENYIGSSKELSIGAISLEQYRRCCIEGSREMNRGGKKTKIVSGSVVEIDMPNQREVYINSVEQFHVIMVPKLNSKYHTDLLEEVQEIDKAIRAEEEKAANKFAEYEEKYKSNDNLFNSKVDELNDNLEIKKVNLSKKKLMALSLLLEEINYYGEGSATN